MKLSKLLFSLVFLFTLSVNFSFAGGTLSVCKGQPVNLVWSSTNNPTACNGTNSNLACAFGSGSGQGYQPISNPQSDCIVGFQCLNAAGPSNYDTATLDVNQLSVWDPNAGNTNPNTGLPEGACVPVPEQSPTGTFTVSATGITLGQSVTVSSTANDGNANMIYHLFDWAAPDCAGYPNTYVNCYSWETGGVGGVTSPAYASTRSSFAEKGSDSFSKTFTPDKSGTYYIYSAAYDTGWVTIGGQSLTVCPSNAPWNGTSCNPSPIGSFDSVSTSYPPHAYGWAADASNNYTTPTQAAFWLQPTTWLPGEYVGTVTCNSVRC